jgi:hypothetical protein
LEINTQSNENNKTLTTNTILEVDEPNDSSTEVLLAQIRELYGRVAYTHKTHEKMADILNNRFHFVKNIQQIINAVITGGIAVTIFGKSETAAIVSGIATLFQLFFNSYTKEFNLGELVQKHTDIAHQLLDIRESYLSLLTDISANLVTNEQIIAKRNELQQIYSEVNNSAPRTNGKAYGLAQKALKLNEELTFSDKEIDVFLPTPLRKEKV